MSKTKSLDSAIDGARSSASAMTEAFNAMPASYAVAAAKVRAQRDLQAALNEKLAQTKSLLAKIESDPTFDKQNADIRSVSTALAKAEAEAAKYEAKIRETKQVLASLDDELDRGAGRGWKGMERTFEEVTADVKKYESELARLNARFNEVDARHRSASMAQSYVQAREEVIRLEAELAKLDSRSNSIQSMGEKYGTIRTLGYGLYSTVTPAIMMMARYAISSAEDIDSSYRNMRKTVNGTEEEFEHLKSAAISFSRTHVTTAQQMLEIESIGGQLGIAADNLEHFGEVVSNLDIATNIEAEDIATYVGQLSNIMDDINTDNVDQYQQDITSFSDALVRLGNNSAAQESNIMKVMMRIASLGNISGFTTPQLLGISTAVAATGQGAEAAGTAISRTFSNIEAAVGKGGDKLDAFAQVAGMSAQRFADAWTNDPMTAFSAFIGGLRAIDDAGGSVDSTLASLGISSVRQKQALEGLTNTFDIMTDSINMSTSAWEGMSYVTKDGSIEQAGDAAREAQRKSEGFSGAIQMLRNNATALSASLADGAAPIISTLAGLFQLLTGAVEAAPGPLKTFIALGAGIVSAFGPAMIAIGALGNAVANFKKLRIDRAKERLELLTEAEAAYADAAAYRKLSLEREKAALSAARVAAANGDDAAAAVASGQASKYHAEAMAQENAMMDANAKKASAAGGAKGKLASTNLALSKSSWSLAKYLGISNGMLLAYGAGITAASIAIYALWDASNRYTSHVDNLTNGTKKLSSEVDAAKANYERLAAQYGENSDEAIRAKAAYEDLNAELQANSKTCGQLASEMLGVSNASRELRESLGESQKEADTESGSLLNTAEAVERLRTASDDASGIKLAAYIATLNGQLDGYSLTVEDARNNTEKYKSAMADVEDQARQLRLDSAIDSFVRLNQQADTIKTAMAELIEESGLTQEAIDAYKGLWSSGQYTNDPTGGQASAYVTLERELDAVNSQMTEAQKLVQENLDKNAAAAEAIKLKTGYHIEEADALAYVNNMLGTNITTADLEAYSAKQMAAEEAAVSEELSNLAVGLQDAAEKYPALNDAIANSGMTFETLAAWLQETGVSAEDFANGIEAATTKAADGVNKIDTESGISLENFMSNLESNKATVEAWGNDMGILWEQYSTDVSDSGKSAVEGFLGYLQNLGPEYAGLVNEIAESGNLESIALEFESAGNSGANAFLNGLGTMSTDASNIAQQAIQDMANAVSENLEMEGNVEIEDNKDEVIEDLKEIDDYDFGPKTVDVGADASNYNKTIDAIMSTPLTKTVTIKGDSSGAGFAAGGIALRGIARNARGGMFDKLVARIPMHASGSINGIVKQATLTNIGWVGEAGTEAVMHMRNGSGAVVPLSNRHYVRPFARAVAQEQAGLIAASQPPINVSVTVNARTDADANEIAGVAARKVKQIMMARGR